MPVASPGPRVEERRADVEEHRKRWTRTLSGQRCNYSATDEDIAHEIYHDDAVLEFPQSGERFEGVANFREWRRIYPAKVDFEIRRVRGRDDLWLVELVLRYDGGPWKYGVDILEFRGDKVSRESAYSMEGWEAPEWRARWRAAPVRKPDGAPASQPAADPGGA